MSRQKFKPRDYKVGDEISYALASGVRYGTVIRLLEDLIEVEFEDGAKEMKKARDRRLRLLKRPGEKETRRRYYSDIQEVRRSDIRRGK